MRWLCQNGRGRADLGFLMLRHRQPKDIHRCTAAGALNALHAFVTRRKVSYFLQVFDWVWQLDVQVCALAQINPKFDVGTRRLVLLLSGKGMHDMLNVFHSSQFSQED
jgi:hypothetical protein